MSRPLGGELAARDLRNPLFRNGYALMANTAITAVLGMGYWLLAAALYTPEEFGRGQAVITAMRLFASLTALGFVGALAASCRWRAAAPPSSSCAATAWPAPPAVSPRSASC